MLGIMVTIKEGGVDLNLVQVGITTLQGSIVLR